MTIQMRYEDLVNLPNYVGLAEVEIPNSKNEKYVDVYSEKCTFYEFMTEYMGVGNKSQFEKYYYLSKISAWTTMDRKYPMNIAIKCKSRKMLKNGLVITPGGYLLFKYNPLSKVNMRVKQQTVTFKR